MTPESPSGNIFDSNPTPSRERQPKPGEPFPKGGTPRPRDPVLPVIRQSEAAHIPDPDLPHVRTSMDYVRAAMLTKTHYYNKDAVPADVLHAVMGIADEAGEMVKIVKTALFYGQGLRIDYPSLDEELGDLLWFAALYANWRGIPFETFMQANIAKLKRRYPRLFSTKNALNRDENAEREAMDSVLSRAPARDLTKTRAEDVPPPSETPGVSNEGGHQASGNA